MSSGMKISVEKYGKYLDEIKLINKLLSLDNCRMVDIGCGKADMTEAIANDGRGRSILALETDVIQHEENVKNIQDPNIEFVNSGAQYIPVDNDQYDVVFMFKSLHHLPVGEMGIGLDEVHRVLKKGGHLYVSEPVFNGDFNEILRIFHDEEYVRERAFCALESSVLSRQFELVTERHINTRICFETFAEFEERIVKATHSNNELSDVEYETVYEKYLINAINEKACFSMPLRIDLLQKPLN